MGFQKGENGGSTGRPRGIKNKNTIEIKEAYKKLLEDNLDNMSTWLADVAADDPDKAINLMLKLSEYIIPKLARQEITGADGEDLFKNIKFEFGDNTENSNKE
jgi:hypothetical protein